MAKTRRASSKSSGSGSYEKERKQRLDENRKRMEQLNLPQLSQSLLHPPIKPKRPYVKKPKVQLQDSKRRRSSRMSDKPPPTYKEFEEASSRGGHKFHRREDYYEKSRDAIVRGQELELSLGSEFPTFIKPLLLSAVTASRLILPVSFCKTHLTDQDQMFTLVDEDGDKWQVKYYLDRYMLAAGWRQVSVHHKLVDGDVLVFQLIKPATFKIYIIRANASEEDEEQDSEES